MIEIAILGHGVVGSGVVEVLSTHKDSILKRAQNEIDIKYILDLKEFPDSPFADRFTKNFDDIIQDDDVKIVVEVMGGLHPAFEFVKQCLEKGKSVVTSNKELVASKGAELLKIAKEKNVNFLFEASVGGGIPIIRPIHQCLAANDVIEIAGILNGTTNFILTKMIRDQMSFEDALALAQKLGYAERNPAADIEGDDACRKICILASLAFGKHVYPDQVHTEGITKVTLGDVEYAEAWGGVIKLIGRVKMMDDHRIQIIVCPMLIPRESQLANVDDVFNGIMVRGDATGDVVFYGKGAGKLPTASAVVADVIDCAKHIHARKNLFWSDSVDNYVQDYLDDITAMYVRVTADDVAAAKTEVEAIFGAVELLVQKNAPKNELAFVTKPMQEREIHEKISELEGKGVTIASTIRVGDL
ncbi:MAG: homoserine dehydrogenase [Acutalibacteraceae bacterium]|nr:homoserine dehydrogenase [Acutalibacteraceae bacterium]